MEIDESDYINENTEKNDALSEENDELNVENNTLDTASSELNEEVGEIPENEDIGDTNEESHAANVPALQNLDYESDADNKTVTLEKSDCRYNEVNLSLLTCL